MLTDTSPAASAIAPLVPSLRQRRLEENVTQAIVEDGPRSAIRQAVDQLVLHLSARRVPAAHGVAIVIDVASRAMSSMPGDSRALLASDDGLALVAGWATARYARDD